MVAELRADRDQKSNSNMKLYKERWLILCVHVLLLLSNNGHWASFASVTKSTSKFYDQPGDRIDLIVISSILVAIPLYAIAAVLSNNFGLKLTLCVAGGLNSIGMVSVLSSVQSNLKTNVYVSGGLMCALSSFPLLHEHLSNDFKFYMALLGQFITGIASPMLNSVVTKISQDWFGVNERVIATTIMSLAGTCGEIAAFGLTPQLVDGPEMVPYMNILWSVLEIISGVAAVVIIRENEPPSPPSASVAEVKAQGKVCWLKSFRKLATLQFGATLLFMGLLQGYGICITTKMEQILCARGYSDQFAGMASAVFSLSGILMSVLIGITVLKYGRIVLVTKVSLLLCLISAMVLNNMVLIHDRAASIIISSALTGGFGIGAFPCILEIIAEFTYPVDQSVSLAVIFFSGGIISSVMLLAEQRSYKGLSDEDMLIQTCSSTDDLGHEMAKDYTYYMIFLSTSCFLAITLFVLGIKPEMKRTKADQDPECAEYVINNKEG